MATFSKNMLLPLPWLKKLNHQFIQPKFMRSIQIIILQLFLLSSSAQESTYSSRILDNDQLPIPYVAVYQEGTQNYATTDENGYFELKILSKKFTLQISS